MITSGSQQAIWLIGQLYTPWGENVILENPTYAGAIDVFRMLGAKPHPLRVRGDGFVPDGFEDMLETIKPRLVMLSPTCHAPTGLVMPVDAHQTLRPGAG